MKLGRLPAQFGSTVFFMLFAYTIVSTPRFVPCCADICAVMLTVPVWDSERSASIRGTLAGYTPNIQDPAWLATHADEFVLDYTQVTFLAVLR